MSEMPFPMLRRTSSISLVRLMLVIIPRQNLVLSHGFVQPSIFTMGEWPSKSLFTVWKMTLFCLLGEGAWTSGHWWIRAWKFWARQFMQISIELKIMHKGIASAYLNNIKVGDTVPSMNCKKKNKLQWAQCQWERKSYHKMDPHSADSTRSNK